MTKLSEFKKIEDSISDNLKQLYNKIEELVTENNDLRNKVAELEKQLEGNIKKEQPSTKIGTEKPKSAKITKTKERPSLGPGSIDEENLEELLANDALVSTVYSRLRPVKQLKYRLLAMQMGISIERCKEAVEKLVSAGAVSLDDNGVVTLLK